MGENRYQAARRRRREEEEAGVAAAKRHREAPAAYRRRGGEISGKQMALEENRGIQAAMPAAAQAASIEDSAWYRRRS
jgi:hypothetical protein